MIPVAAGPCACLGNYTIDYHIVAVGVNPHRTDGPWSIRLYLWAGFRV